jgi:hypothetical protein
VSGRGNTAQAVAFLQRHASAGLVVVSAIQPDDRGMITRTFGPEEGDSLGQLLERHQGRGEPLLQRQPGSPPAHYEGVKGRRHSREPLTCRC